VKHRHRFEKSLPIALVAVSFLAGVAVDSLLRTYGPPKPAASADDGARGLEGARGFSRAAPSNAERAPQGSRSIATTGSIGAAPLRVPIDGINVDSMKGGFLEQRAGHEHDAVDLLAPRNTPVHAVSDGTIAKLFFSKGGGGTTIYEFDPAGQYAYYYAHLDHYADGLVDGQPVTKGQVIGYVGTSGNAPPNTPHLHFAVFAMNGDRRWWKGTAIDPYPLFH
jgi:peptidoglycan LD-endopeptidase LytH